MLRYQEAVLEFSASSVDAVAPPGSAGRGANANGRSSRNEPAQRTRTVTVGPEDGSPEMPPSPSLRYFVRWLEA